MGEGKALTVRRIDPAMAARMLAGMEGLDPCGMLTPEGIGELCKGGQCFELAGAVDAVYVVRVENGVAWIDAVRGTGRVDCTAVVDQLVTEMAQGLRCVGMQTARPGLVRKLTRRGWRVTGWVMRKELQ